MGVESVKISNDLYDALVESNCSTIQRKKGSPEEKKRKKLIDKLRRNRIRRERQVDLIDGKVAASNDS